MPALELGDEPIPLWWTSDFINSSPFGTPSEQEKWIVGEFKCSCVGNSRCLAAYCKDDTPNADYKHISPEDVAEADRMGGLMGNDHAGQWVEEIGSPFVENLVGGDGLDNHEEFYAICTACRKRQTILSPRFCCWCATAFSGKGKGGGTHPVTLGP